MISAWRGAVNAGKTISSIFPVDDLLSGNIDMRTGIPGGAGVPKFVNWVEFPLSSRRNHVCFI
jgi:hypothetical protein